MAKTSFSGPVYSTNGFVGGITVPSLLIADLPSAADNTGGIVLVTDATPAAALCFSDGSDWIDLLTGLPVV